MRFRAEHRFTAPVDAVIGLLVDPDFHRQLDLPDVELLDVDDSHSEGDQSHLVLRYRFVGQLDPFARQLLGGRALTWRQELHLDRADGTGRLSFQADASPKRLHGAAELTIESHDGGTLRRLDGELVAKVPLIGDRAERSLVSGLQRRLDIEAQALDGRRI
jgi:Protein of unknown function (DUF2505)